MDGISISMLSVTKAGLYREIRSGLFLSLKVGKALPTGEQEASIDGKRVLLPKITGLIQGKTYKVPFTLKRDGSLLLHVPGDDTPAFPSSSFAKKGPILLEGTGRSLLERQVLEIISKSGLLPSGALVDKLTSLVKGKKPDRLGRALIAIILGKKLNPDREIYEELLPLFLGGKDQSSPEGDRRGQGRREASSEEKREKRSGPYEVSSKSIKSVVTAESDHPTLLNLFNALSGVEGQWIIIPLPVSEHKGDSLKGVMRFLIDPADEGRVKRMVLSLFDDDAGGFHFLFRYPTGGKKPLLSLYLPEYMVKGLQSEEGKEFLKKMDNLGFKIDDIQRVDSFTGYDSDHPIPEGIDLEA